MLSYMNDFMLSNFFSNNSIARNYAFIHLFSYFCTLIKTSAVRKIFVGSAHTRSQE